MTQDRDDPPTAAGPAAAGAADSIGSSGEGVAPPEPDSFTLAGPGSDPAAPAVQPVSGAPAEPDAGASADPPSPTPPPASPGPPITGDYDKYGVPTLDFVRDKIEARYAASLGAEELARQTEEAKSFEQRAEERAKAAEAALEAIRQSLRKHRQS